MKRLFTCWTVSSKIFGLKFDEHGELEFRFEFQADSDFGINLDLVKMKNQSLKDSGLAIHQPVISYELQFRPIEYLNKMYLISKYITVFYDEHLLYTVMH